MMFQTYNSAVQEEAVFCLPCGIVTDEDCATVDTEIDVSMSSRGSFDSGYEYESYDIDNMACLPLGVTDFDSVAVANELDVLERSRRPLAKALVRNATEELIELGETNLKIRWRKQRKNWTPKSMKEQKQKEKASSKQICRFFNSKKGCRNYNCRFVHTFTSP